MQIRVWLFIYDSRGETRLACLLVPGMETFCVGLVWAGWWVSGFLSGSSGRGVVLLQHAGRNAPAFADRDTVLFRPGSDVAAALAA